MLAAAFERFRGVLAPGRRAFRHCSLHCLRPLFSHSGSESGSAASEMCRDRAGRIRHKNRVWQISILQKETIFAIIIKRERDDLIMFPTSIPDLREAIKNDPAFTGWNFRENETIPATEAGTYIASRTFSIWETPDSEEMIVSLINVTLTGSERGKPQMRVDTKMARQAYWYARRMNLRFFCFACCVDSQRDWKFSNGINPVEYIVSIESKMAGGRYDIRSMYDILSTKNGQEFFRVEEGQHNCANLKQGAFISVCGDDGAFTGERLRDYLLHFDSRPYMADAQEGHRPVYTPSALYREPDPEPLALPWNLLVHGAPGTGKSFFLNQKVDEFEKNCPVEMRRVTFYEDYSYGQFVGEYMPVPNETAAETVDIQCPGGPITGNVTGERITYRFSPGPLAETLAKCFAAKLNAEDTKFVLIVEELNRANAASIFGDIFQLLDREKGVSIYEITPRADLSRYLYEAVAGQLKDETIQLSEAAFSKLRLPDNFYLWATMNGADQGVFPLDSAFKRRWSYLYRDIYEVAPACAFRPWICLPLLDASSGQLSAARVSWDPFRTAINERILDAGFAEDRCVGYWFFSEEELGAIEAYTKAAVENKNGDGQTDLSSLPNPLVDKLFAYLIQAVFRNVPASFFSDGINGLSQVRRALKQLEIDGRTVGMQDIVQLPASTYVATPSTEVAKV